jgi:zinc protease
MIVRIRISLCLIFVAVLGSTTPAQVPPPGPAKSVDVPAVKESRLKNGLRVAAVERHSVPIVTVQLVVRSGASDEGMAKAGLADMTATMLTKGTKTRSAEQIAEETEFLGTSISSGAGWNSSSVTMTVTSDKLDQAMAIMADIVLNPSFTQKELDLLRAQALDGLKYNLTQPTFLASYVASVHSFKEHPADGTASSIESVTQTDLQKFYGREFRPGNSVLIFAGDVTFEKATSVAETLFGKWGGSEGKVYDGYGDPRVPSEGGKTFVKRILVVDLPGAGQASVNFFKPIAGFGRGDREYYTAAVLNSLVGGGYSSRLNQEIRIKRGLSYGAGSGFGWRSLKTNFSARTQTKNESAPEVASLVIAELKRLAETDAAETELNPRRLVLTGGFGLNLETASGLAGSLAELYIFGIPSEELNKYVPGITAVSPVGVKTFAARNLYDGDLIIVGDYKIFKDDLAKRFPNVKIDVVTASELNIESPTLKKSDVP